MYPVVSFEVGMMIGRLMIALSITPDEAAIALYMSLLTTPFSIFMPIASH